MSDALDNCVVGVVGRNQMADINGAAPVKQVGVNSNITILADYTMDTP